MNRPWTVSRRSLLKGVGAGVLVGFVLPARAGATPVAATHQELVAAYVRIDPDGWVSIVTADAELGQGILSTHAMIIADEMGADWARLRVGFSGAGLIYANPHKGRQATYGSTGVTGFFQLLRQVGASARMQLCMAAGMAWNVPWEECDTRDSQVLHRGSNRRAGFADLAERASQIDPSEDVEWRPDEALRFIGRSMPRQEIPAMVSGAAEYAADVKLAGMKHAAIRFSPVFGGKLKSVKARTPNDVAGVYSIVELANAVAVVADSWWEANQALDTLDLVFDEGPASDFDSDEMIADLVAGLKDADSPVRLSSEHGHPDAVMADAAEVIEGVYTVPYLAHATMEPMSCVARVQDGACELWCGTQSPMGTRDAAARVLGIVPEKVTLHRTFAGGGFGRRGRPDYTNPAVAIAAEMPGVPVKLIWSREQDIRHDFYRPAHALHFRAALGRDGEIAALKLRLGGASMAELSHPGSLAGGLVDSSSIGGLADHPYRTRSERLEWLPWPTPVPIGSWRSVAHSQNVFFIESVIDELAHQAGRDPLEFRLSLIDDPEIRSVVARAAEHADWGTPLKPGHGRGISLTRAFGSIVAQVMEVSVPQSKRLSVKRIVSVVDCGRAVHPGNVKAQIEGGMLYGLTAAVFGAIDVKAGRVQQSNFSDYGSLMLRNVPRIETYLSESGRAMGGAGEPGTPPAAPALANAIFAACGERVRGLPLASAGWQMV